MKIQTLLLALVATVVVATVGCDDGTDGTTTSSASSSGSGSGSSSSGGAAVMPTLGAQVDRMGRPAINTAGNATFEADPEKADMSKNAYNTSSDPAKWSDFIPEVQKNLAILDSLDANCGNQLAADKTKMDPSRYAALAGVLTDDRLYVNAAGATCGAYLGVEANALGVLPNMDCGGRTLAYDVIETSYSVLAAGALSGVDDTIAISESAKGTTFPYLAAPH
jgi:hypothetical protein